MSRLTAAANRHPAMAFAIPVLLLALAAGGWLLANSLRVPEVSFAQGAPIAPQLVANTPDEVVYRIDPSRSSVRYEVEEVLAGTSQTATGITRGVGGDIVLNTATPSASRIGEIVVNVEQLTSDQRLRDDRLRHDFLQSSQYPLAKLTTTAFTGLPDRLEDGTDYAVELRGDLTVRDIPKPVTVTATARRSGDTVTVIGSTTVKLSDWGIGPISLGPLVTTGNDAKLLIDVTATEPATMPAAELATGSGPTTAPTGGGPSFANTIQPILEKNCSSCHTPGQSGSGVWTLDTAADAQRVAGGLGLVTGSGYMPPWPASDAGIPLKHSRRMSDADVTSIAEWAAADGPLDVDPSTKIEPAESSLEAEYAIRQDQVLTYDEPYQGSTDTVNDYRCFVLDPGFTDRRFITGFEFLPDQVPVVHHALGFKVTADRRDEVTKSDADDPGAGWQCYAGMSGPGGSQGLDGASNGSQLITGWVPGQRPNKFPEGAGIPMEAGDFLVVQVHYHFGHSAPADRSRMAIEVSDQQDLDEVLTQTYLGPAEIPCASDETGPWCDRNKVLERLNGEFGPSATFIANGLMLMCGKSLDDFAGMTDGIASSSCDLRIRRDGELLGMLGHMHEIGKTFRMTLNPGTPDEKILIDIPKWDFQWQLVYSPEEQIMIKRGDVLRVECSWDRSLIKSSEPMYVTWAEGTEDEMCYSTLSTRLTKD